MKRGDLVTVFNQGDFGTPRPALVVQADLFDAHATVTVLPITSALVAAPLLRISVRPNSENGLQKPSQVMVDKTMTVQRDKLGLAFGRIGADAMVEVERCLLGNCQVPVPAPAGGARTTQRPHRTRNTGPGACVGRPI